MKEMNEVEVEDKMIITLFIIEHLILLLVWILNSSISEVPKWVKIFLKRKNKVK